MRGVGGMKKTANLFGTIILLPTGLVGCITVKAPDKPIEINLNVNIKAEVIYKLQKDAQDLITSNPGLFPK